MLLDPYHRGIQFGIAKSETKTIEPLKFEMPEQADFTPRAVLSPSKTIHAFPTRAFSSTSMISPVGYRSPQGEHTSPFKRITSFLGWTKSN